ncbi:MAG: hypothetical protein RLZZ76_502 [Candidatus Parcubacteria bacterium]|jgi:hypothetical protein
MQMDVLVLEGKNYVKSSVIARELGYTSDYVGQLCRSGKVDAKLFGKTWYVEKSSIDGHKRTRYRSSKAVTKRVLHATESSKTSSPIRIHKEPINTSHDSFAVESHFYAHTKRATRVGVTYSDDSTGLIPEPSKARLHKKLAIALADAQKIEITSPKDVYSFETPTMPEIRFKGKLAVRAVEEDTLATSNSDAKEQGIASQVEALPDSATHIHPKDTSRIVVKKPKSKVISSILKNKKKGEMHTVVHELAGGNSTMVPIVATDRVSVSWMQYCLRIFVGLLLGLVISALLISTDAKVTSIAGTQFTDYYLHFDNLNNVFLKILYTVRHLLFEMRLQIFST